MQLHGTIAARVLLFALIAVSGYLFWRRFRVVVDRIQRARPDNDFRLGPVAKRTQTFIWEVLLQGKVIKERPLPGIAHAFVFWGFGAFALVTTNHFASGFGLGFLSLNSAFGRLYFGTAIAFAFLVLVSILGLAFRRFVIRPKWLGPLSMESGVIALLIAILMATYLASFWYLEGTPEAAAIWWAHTAALLIFLPLVP